MRRVLAAESVTSLDTVTGAVLVAGSPGGLIGAVAVAGVGAVIFNDAGFGKDGAGVAGLAWLDMRRIAAAAVAHDRARIGDARSMWDSGVLSHVNAVVAAARGARGGDKARDFAVIVASAC